MHLDPSDARAFIGTYQPLLEFMAGEFQDDESIHWRLIRGRSAMQEAPERLDDARRALNEAGQTIDEDVLAAMRQMRCAQWVYLRDTRSHSIVLDMDGQQAYGVLGLTQRLRDITGESGAIIQTALLPFRGRIICDGLITDLVWIGSNYRRSFNEDVKRLKSEQRFSAHTLTPLTLA